MGRTQYRNGDTLTLVHTGCDGCTPTMINGVFCHETGCPESWRDYARDCFNCGYGFTPKERGQCLCVECIADSE